MKTFTNIVATMIVAAAAAAPTTASTYEVSDCNKFDDAQCLQSPECVTIRTGYRWLRAGDKDESLCVQAKLAEGGCYWNLMYEIRDPQNCGSVPGCVWIEDKEWCVPESMAARAVSLKTARGSNDLSESAK